MNGVRLYWSEYQRAISKISELEERCKRSEKEADLHARISAALQEKLRERDLESEKQRKIIEELIENYPPHGHTDFNWKRGKKCGTCNAIKIAKEHLK